MKILLISWYFPPINDIGAIRIARLAEYLRDKGHDVHVLTGDRESQDRSLSTTFPECRVTRTPWFDVNDIFRFRRRRSVKENAPDTKSSGGEIAKKSPGFREKLKSALADLYVDLTWIPDHQVGWISYAKRAGTNIMALNRFDLIYASGPPFSAFVVAKSLSRKSGVPWIAEYRDGWSGYVYNMKPAWRELIDSNIERRVTRAASAIVALSESWARFYEDRFGLPTIAVYNGIDSLDALAGVDAPRSGEQLQITYVGVMYGGLRDPSVLYDAIRQLRLAPSQLRINYYGPDARDIYPLADKFGVSEFIALNERIPHKKSLEIQRASDILLLLQSPEDPHNVPAKFFEYLAARRPILGLGLDEGIPARLIRERAAGFYETNPEAVARQLQVWIDQKKRPGSIADLDLNVSKGFAREEQFQKLEQFLSAL